MHGTPTRPEEDGRRLHGGRHHPPPPVQVLPQEERGVLGDHDPVPGGPAKVGRDKEADDGELHRETRGGVRHAAYSYENGRPGETPGFPFVTDKDG